MTCPDCGGEIIGDGVTQVLRCEFVDYDPFDSPEPDSDPVFCGEVSSPSAGIRHPLAAILSAPSGLN